MLALSSMLWLDFVSQYFSKHTKRNFEKCFHFMFVHNGTMSMSAQRVYVQLFTAHCDYWAKITITSAAFAPRLIVSTRVILQIENKWKSTFFKPYESTSPSDKIEC